MENFFCTVYGRVQRTNLTVYEMESGLTVFSGESVSALISVSMNNNEHFMAKCKYKKDIF